MDGGVEVGGDHDTQIKADWAGSQTEYVSKGIDSNGFLHFTLNMPCHSFFRFSILVI